MSPNHQQPNRPGVGGFATAIPPRHEAELRRVLRILARWERSLEPAGSAA